MGVWKYMLSLIVLFVSHGRLCAFDQKKFAVRLLKSNIIENKNLTDKINSILSISRKFKVYEIVMPGVFYAFTIGGKSIYITSDYLKLLSKREQLSVILHEVGHLVERHSLKTIITLYPLNLLYIYFGIIVGTEIKIWGVIITTFLIVFTSIFYTRFIKRRYETSADNYAAKAGYGLNFISSLKKGEIIKNRVNLKTPPSLFYKIREKYRYYFGCYLPTEERVANLLEKHNEYKLAISKKLNV